MTQPFVGEIRIFAGTFAPAGWMFCDGELLPISEYETLFNLIGTTYGGDGQSTFALPDLRGRLPLHQGSGFTLAQTGGAEGVTLTIGQLPSHTHAMFASADNATNSAALGNVLAQTPTYTPYISDNASVALSAASMSSFGGNQPHSNLQPYLCVSFILSLFGIFPSQT